MFRIGIFGILAFLVVANPVAAQTLQPLSSQPVPAPDVLPAGWAFRPLTEHPCLLTTPAALPVLKTRLMAEYGSLDKVPNEYLRAYVTGDLAERKQATADFEDYWKTYSKRWRADNLTTAEPDGVSMRGIRRCILNYDLVASFGTLTDDQTHEFRDAMVNAVELAIGSDAEHPRITPHPHFRTQNIWTDVVAAAGWVGLEFPELPQARGWVNFADNEIDWEFQRVVWDGAWHESPRYHAAVLNIVGLYYVALANRTGIDRFSDPHFKAMLDWLVRFETPLDRVAGKELGIPAGVALAPGIGDSSWSNIPLGQLGEYAPRYVASDPAFAHRLMWAWRRGGAVMRGDEVEWADLLTDPAIAATPQLLGSDCSPPKGYVEMWSGGDSNQSLWFLFRCGQATKAGHDHADDNAFNLYADGVPLALDAGSGDYSLPSQKAWHDIALAHNTVVFGDRSQKRKDGSILAFASRPEADYSVSDASVPAGVAKYVRHVLMVKPDYVVIWDELSSTEDTHWMLHTTATNFQWSPHSVRCLTPYGVNLDVHVVLPVTPLVPGVQKGRFGDWKVEGEPRKYPLPFYYQNYFGIPNQAGQDFIVVLHPIKRGATPLTVTRVGNSTPPVLNVACGAQKDHIAFRADGVLLTRVGPKRVTVLLPNEAPAPGVH